MCKNREKRKKGEKTGKKPLWYAVETVGKDTFLGVIVGVILFFQKVFNAEYYTFDDLSVLNG